METLDKQNLEEIKTLVNEFFSKMTFPVDEVEVLKSSDKKEKSVLDSVINVFSRDKQEETQDEKEFIEICIKTREPQILIGQKGQTLFEIQKLLRILLNKKIKKFFYVNVDINDYKKEKNTYLKNLARDIVDKVRTTKEKKVLLPMSSFERRIIHAELASIPDITTESFGKEPDRYIVVSPK